MKRMTASHKALANQIAADLGLDWIGNGNDNRPSVWVRPDAALPGIFHRFDRVSSRALSALI